MPNDKIEKLNLTDSDLSRIKERGITLEDIIDQINYLKKGTNYVKLVRPCTLGDGIKKIEDNYETLIELHNKAQKEGRVMRFVPASGAASRMFKKLEKILNASSPIKLSSLKNSTDEVEAFAYEFIKNLEKFAFNPELINLLSNHGLEINLVSDEIDVRIILKYLLTNEGMNYSNISKALIKFHEYDIDKRTAFEEQIVESIHYAKDNSNKIRIHFTKSPDQKELFVEHAEELKNKYADKGVHIDIDFSFQKPSTDTIALNHEGELFRNGNNEILFRPGGHGALIYNLNDLDGDIVFIKNIDNVQREENLIETVKSKKILSGLLIKLQNKSFQYLRDLENEEIEKQKLDEIKDFIKDELQIELNEDDEKLSSKEREKYYRELLNRPIRVCGMVKNEGHPGGGPFWIEDKNGKIRKQIVESAQINKQDEKQKEILETATHFNPVDIVCGLRNYKGEKFDLEKYIDHDAVFISHKSDNGEELIALELPGLWNGAMYDWNTIFVEVPASTFTPVKEVNDLLKSYHQPE